MKKKKKPEVFWAVTGSSGFYTGMWLNRSTAKNEHARMVQLDGETYGAAWKRRKRDHGDRVVKIHVSEVKRK